jgi:ABC-type transport system involved in multi-copper enzyme maturation permease subunit
MAHDARIKFQGGKMSDNRVSYVYGGKIGALVCLSVLLIFFWSMATLSAMRGEWSNGTASLGMSLLFLLIFGLLMIARSDVVISDQGVARALWGWTWRTIDWSNIELIKEFPASKGNGQFVRGLNIFPRVKPTPRFTPSGKVFFTMDMKNSPQLIQCLNLYIAARGIALVVSDTPLGKPQPAAQLRP